MISTIDIVTLALTALGGVGLFLLGMEMMARALEDAFGYWLRLGLQRLARRPFLGLLGATGISAAIHSGPTTVMIVGFINAGMITLADSIPLILGANIGTTLAMQLVAFDLGYYAVPIVAIGSFLRFVALRNGWRHWGNLLIGFGLLFIGLHFVKTPLPEIRDAQIVRTLAESVTSMTFIGFLWGVLLSTVLTSMLMSSGATIAVLFALADEGILTTFDQIFPFILGAHIGTCMLTLIGALPMSGNAKRAALAHLIFNVVGAVMALMMARFYLWIIPLMSDDLVRQTANANTLVQLVNALIFLPFMVPYARLVERIFPSRSKTAETSYLDPALLEAPEAALSAVMFELRREARLCAKMLNETLRGLMDQDRGRIQKALQIENAVDVIKRGLTDYFTRLGQRRLTGRQSTTAQHLATCSSDLERIGDHIETIARVANERIDRGIWFEEGSILEFMKLGELGGEILEHAVESLDPSTSARPELADGLLEKRRQFKKLAGGVRQRFNERLASGAEKPLNGLLFMRMLDAFDGMMRHIKSIARAERQDEIASIRANGESAPAPAPPNPQP